jgi:flagellar motor switch protein FliN/FliY
MEKELFSPMELDALGEMMNISLGSSATAVSNLLDHRVDITTPTVTIVPVGEFAIGNLEPAMGVEIKYVEGLDGSNIMLLKRSDIRAIVDILMGMETPDEEFELNELTISAVCEVMNQMMGSAATAMSDFLGFQVDISTPQPFELEGLEEFKLNHLPTDSGSLVVVRFSLKIEGAVESEFMNVMSVRLAKDLLKQLGLGDEDEEEAAPPPPPAPAPEPESSGGGGRMMSQEEIERMLSGGGAEAAPAPAPAPAPQPQPAAQPAPQPAAQSPQPPVPPYGMPPAAPGAEGMAYPGYPYPPYPYPPYPYPPQAAPAPAATVAPEPKVIATKPVSMEEMEGIDGLGKEQAQNLDLIMEVPLQVTVEIGRTERKVQDILEFSKGSLVVLDKLAGDQVDLFVNGKCVARGDVVVIDDNFGLRITEIVQKPSLVIPTKKK